MALPTWPATLPDLRGEVGAGGTDALVPQTMATQFDDGPDRVRRRTLFVSTPLKIALDLEPVSLVVLQGFVRDTLNGGARRFTGPVLLPGGAVGQRTCRIKDGLVAVAYRGPEKPIASFTLVVFDW